MGIINKFISKNKCRLPILILSLSSAIANAGSERDLSFSSQCRNAETTSTISFVGDILVHNDLYMAVANKYKSFAPLWSQTDSLIQKADYSVANLEGPAALGIDNRGRDRGDVGFIYEDGQRDWIDATDEQKKHMPAFVYSGTGKYFNFHPRILSDLKKSGYDLISTANNHSLDRNSIGIDRTLEAAKLADLTTVGTRASYDTGAEFYVVRNIKGINVAFISCTAFINGRKTPHAQILYCNGDQIFNLISNLSKRSEVDSVVVLPHWGEEYEEVERQSQRDLGRAYMEAGASVVVGSHPHVLQPWEKHITKDGRETLIIYSLGNFVAYQGKLPRKTAVVAYVGLSKFGSGKALVSGAAYTPTQRPGGDFALPIHNMDEATEQIVVPKFGDLNRIKPKESLSKICQ